MLESQVFLALAFLLGLAANGFEPVGMRYLRLADDGSIQYLTEADIAAQKHEGWVCLPDHYDDGGFSGGNMDRILGRKL